MDISGRRLKFKIVRSYFILLTIGMILIDIVVVTFWQKDMINKQIESGVALLSIIVDQSHWNVDKSSSYFANALKKLPLKIGSNVVNGAYYNRYEKIILNENINPEFIDVVKNAMASSRSVVRFRDKCWTVFTPGYRFAVVALPIKTTTAHRSSIGIVIDFKPDYDELRNKQKIIFTYIFINVMILCVAGLFRMVKFVIKPLDNLVMISESYNDPESGLLFTENNETGFGKLAISLNMMLQRINQDHDKLKSTIVSLEIANDQLKKSQQEVVTAEKMSAVGVLSAGLAHEIGNPLGVVQGYLELLSDENLSTEERAQFSGRAIAEIERVDTLIGKLLKFSKTSAADDEIGNVVEILNELESMLVTQKDIRSIFYSTSIDIDNGILIKGRNCLFQVLLNCILNSVDALIEEKSRTEKKIHLACSIAKDNAGKNWLSLTIEDNGSGISERVLPLIFDPFYSTKEPGKGTGLGLSVSYSLVDIMGGKIRAESEEGESTKIFITLPVYKKKSLKME